MPFLEDVLAEHEPEEIFTDVQDADPTIVIYTSGTTALPKGVVLTFLGMSVYVTNTVEPIDPTNENPDGDGMGFTYNIRWSCRSLTRVRGWRMSRRTTLLTALSCRRCSSGSWNMKTSTRRISVR